MNKLAYWKDKRVEDLSREELLGAVHYFAGRVAALNDPMLVRKRAVNKVNALKIPVAVDPTLKPGEWYFDYPGRPENVDRR